MTPMVRNPSTKRHIKYWRERKIDWNQAYTSTVSHPHRILLLKALKNVKFESLCELGCASAPNLIAVRATFPYVQVGGVDINEDAIALARQTIPSGIFDVRPLHDTFFTDRSADIVLLDMALIYYSPFMIDKAMKEIRRLCRNRVFLIEFHSTKWFLRQGLRLASGYHAYDYRKLLTKHGFYDIEMEKIREEDWPGGEPQKTFAHIITARAPYL